MGTIAEKLQKLIDTKNAIKTAIIAKGQAIADSDTFASYAAKISAIETGVDTSDATATENDALSGKTFYANGEKRTGNIPTVEQATPSISLDTSGLITASAEQPAGYVTAGTKSATQKLTTQEAQTITPGTTDKTISAGKYLTGVQTIKGDSNLVASNIKNGVSIFGVSGTASTLGSRTVVIGNDSVEEITVSYVNADGSFSSAYAVSSGEYTSFSVMSPSYFLTYVPTTTKCISVNSETSFDKRTIKTGISYAFKITSGTTTGQILIEDY